MGCANPVGICELSPEVCLIVAGSKQTASGLLGGQSLKKKKKERKKERKSLPKIKTSVI